jgi:cellulose synthase/poly-beta-1,6-N-acetylglucosamine synthase-like glycosyltransferase
VKIGFWLSMMTLIYTWGGYFLLLVLFSKLRKKNNIDYCDNDYSVTVLITVCNEEDCIEERLHNLIDQDFDKHRFEILIASDGSTDNTDNIVKTYLKKYTQIRLFQAESSGKSAVQNIAIPLSKGDIIVLSDADTLFEPHTLNHIVKHFADNKIGCVSGRLVLNKAEGSVAASQSLYWRYEMVLRSMESEIGVMHTTTGGVMAFRKDLFRPFDPKYGEDCIIPLSIVEHGYNVIHEEMAIAYDSFPSSMGGELRARARMTVRNITCTISKYNLLNPFRYPSLSWAIISHKILRWLTPFFLIGALTANAFLIDESMFYLIVGIGQCFFYLLGLIGLLCELLEVRILFASQIFSFLLANTGFLLGLLQAIAGKRITAYKNRSSCRGA